MHPLADTAQPGQHSLRHRSIDHASAGLRQDYCLPGMYQGVIHITGLLQGLDMCVDLFGGQPRLQGAACSPPRLPGRGKVARQGGGILGVGALQDLASPPVRKAALMWAGAPTLISQHSQTASGDERISVCGAARSSIVQPTTIGGFRAGNDSLAMVTIVL